MPFHIMIFLVGSATAVLVFAVYGVSPTSVSLAIVANLVIAVIVLAVQSRPALATVNRRAPVREQEATEQARLVAELLASGYVADAQHEARTYVEKFGYGPDLTTPRKGR